VRRVMIEELEPGMIVGRTVSGADGRPLLTQNMQLSEKYIQKLINLGIASVYIKDNFTDIEIPEVVSSEVMTKVASNLKSSLINLSAQKAIDTNILKKGVSMLIDNILSNRHLLVHLEDIHSYNDYLFFHSVNVAILSIMTGLSLGYNDGDMADLGLGALLHDIGMIMVDQKVVNKTEKLTPAEMMEVKNHPEIGFNMLRNLREVSAPAAHIAYQHHERFDGTGYPRKMMRKQILEYARIAAVADTFDALTSDHPYRKAYSTTEALIIINKLAGTHFDPDIVAAFQSNVALYPVGSMVLLNTGHVAVVTSVTRFNQDKPVIHVICDQNGKLVKKFFKVDLSRTAEVIVVRHLSKEETNSIHHKVKHDKAMKEKDRQSAAV